MKVCIYLEFLKGHLSKHLKFLRGGGTASAYKHKIISYKLNDISYTTEPKEKDYDILQIEIPGPKSLMYIKKAKKAGKKVVISTHITAREFKGSVSFGGLSFASMKKYLRYFYSQADLLISPSDYTKNIMRKEYGINKPILVLSNGIDPAFVKYGKGHRKKWNKKNIVVGNVGNVVRRKGVFTFIKVAKEFPEVNFKWFGIIDKKMLFDVDKVEIPDNLKFTGFVKNIKRAYSSIDVFLFPSFEENQGIVILEAASFGLPIVVRNLPAYRGWLKSGKNCLKCKNEKEFVSNVRKVLEDKKMRIKISKNADKLSQEHNLKKIGGIMKKNYQDLIGR